MDRVIVWDWNGTILNDVPLNIEILNNILLEYHIKPIDYDEYKNLFCFPIKSFYQKLGFHIESDEEYFSIIDKFNSMYRKRMFEPHLQDDAIEVLSELEKQNYIQLLLSGLNVEDLVAQVKNFELFSLFHRVIGSKTNDANDKDNNLKRILQSYNKNSIVLIGDTTAELKLSSDNNCKAILVTCGHQSENVISKKTALYCNSLSDIFQYLNM